MAEEVKQRNELESIIKKANEIYLQNGASSSDLSKIDDYVIENFDLYDLCSYGKKVQFCNKTKLAQAICEKFLDFFKDLSFSNVESKEKNVYMTAYFCNNILSFAENLDAHNFSIIQSLLVNTEIPIFYDKHNNKVRTLARLADCKNANFKTILKSLCSMDESPIVIETLKNMMSRNISDSDKERILTYLVQSKRADDFVYEYQKENPDLTEKVLLKNASIGQLCKFSELYTGTKTLQKFETIILFTNGGCASDIVYFLKYFGKNYHELQKRLAIASLGTGEYKHDDAIDAGFEAIKSLAMLKNVKNQERDKNKILTNLAKYIDLETLDDVIANSGYFDLIARYLKDVERANFQKLQKAFLESTKGFADESKTQYIVDMMKHKRSDKNALLGQFLKSVGSTQGKYLVKVGQLYPESVPELEKHLLSHKWFAIDRNDLKNVSEITPTIWFNFANKINSCNCQKIYSEIQRRYPKSTEAKRIRQAEKGKQDGTNKETKAD